MDSTRRVEAIRCTLGAGEEGAAEIRSAARALESALGVGQVLAAVADPRFPNALIAAAERGGEPEVLACFTVAAAGARRARQVLAWRASQLVDPDELVALAMAHRRRRERGFERLAAAGDPAVAAAWELLAHLRTRELRAMVRARPALASAHRRRREAHGSSRARPLRLALG